MWSRYEFCDEQWRGRLVLWHKNWPALRFNGQPVNQKQGLFVMGFVIRLNECTQLCSESLISGRSRVQPTRVGFKVHFVEVGFLRDLGWALVISPGQVHTVWYLGLTVRSYKDQRGIVEFAAQWDSFEEILGQIHY